MLPIIAARASKSKRNFFFFCKKCEGNLSTYCRKCKKGLKTEMLMPYLKKFCGKSSDFYWVNRTEGYSITTLVHDTRPFLRFPAKRRALQRGRLSAGGVKHRKNRWENVRFPQERQKKSRLQQAAPEKFLIFVPA